MPNDDILNVSTLPELPRVYFCLYYWLLQTFLILDLTSLFLILQWCPCEDAPDQWIYVPDVDYDPDVVTNLATDYSNENLEKERDDDSPTAPIRLTFKLANHDDIDNVSPSSQVSEINYAAVIFDDEFCQGNIIGQAWEDPEGTSPGPEPHLASRYQGQGSPLVLGPASTPNPAIGASLDVSDKEFPVLELDFWPYTFRGPFYEQDMACVDSEGLPSKCGLLHFCVEFQALDDCGRKLDFVDVKIEVQFELLESCEGNFCGEIILQRAPVIEDSNVLDIGDLFCYPCISNGPVLGGGDLPSVSLSQGREVELCLDVKPGTFGEKYWQHCVLCGAVFI